MCLTLPYWKDVLLLTEALLKQTKYLACASIRLMDEILHSSSVLCDIKVVQDFVHQPYDRARRHLFGTLSFL